MLRYLQKYKDILQMRLYFPRNEDGFLLVLTMFVLVVLTLIGISATNVSRIELQIAGNDRVHKETFYQADGGTEVGALLLEENLACPNGFSGTKIDAVMITDTATDKDAIRFGLNETEPTVAYPSDTKRHIKYNSDAVAGAYNDALPHTNLYFFGKTVLATGSAIQMVAGYEGAGYSAASGGGTVITNIDSQHIGVQNSLSNIRVVWRHIIGHEGTCKY